MKVINGFIVIDKPEGITSHDCIIRLRKLFGIKRIGHGGTLDPAVTGVLPIAIGNATRLLQFMPGEKRYKGIIQFGLRTNTDDFQGEVYSKEEWPLMDNVALDYVVKKFKGCFNQRPPNFSSININGERAYKKARRGESFKINSRPVNINKINIINWDQDLGQLSLEVHCSAGTYIRSLARDIGEDIGCGACLLKLRRTQALGFIESQAEQLPDLYNKEIKNAPTIIPPSSVLGHLPKVTLNGETEIYYWQTGRKIEILETRIDSPNKSLNLFETKNELSIQVFGKNNQLEGIAILEEGFVIQPKIVFNPIG